MRTARCLTPLLILVLTACEAAPPAEDAEADIAAMPAADHEPGSDDWKIASAESAAPASVGRDATVMDWPEEEGGAMRELRAGTNGFVCLPDNPATDGPDPMCLDSAWQSWMEAYGTQAEPEVDQVGISYMLGGDAGVSNIDPYDYGGPTADNEWVESGPHLMVLVPDAADLEGFPSDPSTGGPYIMWRGTPYAHIMVPVADQP